MGMSLALNSYSVLPHSEIIEVLIPGTDLLSENNQWELSYLDFHATITCGVARKKGIQRNISLHIH